MNKIEWNNRSEILLKENTYLFHAYGVLRFLIRNIYTYIVINNHYNTSLSTRYPLWKLITNNYACMHASISMFQGILYVPRIGSCGSLLLSAAAIWPFQRGRSWWYCHHSRQKIMAIWWHVRGKLNLHPKYIHLGYFKGRRKLKWKTRGFSKIFVQKMCIRCSIQPAVCFLLPILGLSWLLLDRLGDDPVVFPSPRRKGICKEFYLLYHHTYSN